jgi:hypothetical protein
MNHGGAGADLHSSVPKTSGPRNTLQLGLDASKASQNILRLLETSHGVGAHYADSLSTAWYKGGIVWRLGDEQVWKPSSVDSEVEFQQSSTFQQALHRSPSLLTLSFSDERTALAKIQGMDGRHRYISLLRLDPDPHVVMHSGMQPNDGWHILREVIGGTPSSSTTSNEGKDSNLFSSLHETLHRYLSIEHGGGLEDREQAERLFCPHASLLAVGTAPEDEPPTDWSAPVGSLLEIPRTTYLEGVASRTPHSPKSARHDSILHMDVLPCQTAAAATVTVGNAAQTAVFVDHLLLGRHQEEEEQTAWRVLSKTFAPSLWPSNR